MECTMAQAESLPTGFEGASQAPQHSTDGPLSQLHEWQASPAGMIAAHVVDLVSTVAQLEKLAGNPVHFRLMAAELAELHLVQTELGRLASRICRTQGVAA